MDLKRLHEILAETTVQLRKGEEVSSSEENGIKVVHVMAMVHESEAPREIEMVDLEFLMIGVDKEKAEARREEFISILESFPDPDTLAKGPSYIEVGGIIGDQGAAFQMFALGEVLGLWSVITPKTFGFEGQEAVDMAGKGYIMISGFKKDESGSKVP